MELGACGPDELVEELVHLHRGFLFAAVEPPAEEGEHASGESGGASSEFARWHVFEATGFDEAAFDPAREVAFGQIVEVFEVAGGGEDAVELVFEADVGEKFGDGHDTVGFVFLIAEHGAHCFAEHFELAHEQVVNVPVVQVEGRASDARAVEHILDGYVADGFLENEVEEGGAELHAGATNAGIVFSHR
jgi:hypothetical protein